MTDSRYGSGMEETREQSVEDALNRPPHLQAQCQFADNHRREGGTQGYWWKEPDFIHFYYHPERSGWFCTDCITLISGTHPELVRSKHPSLALYYRSTEVFMDRLKILIASVTRAANNSSIQLRE